MEITLYVSIGRNIQDQPLPETAWEDFKVHSFNAVAQYGNVLTFTHGKGAYGDVFEDSSMIVATIEHGKTETIRKSLIEIAKRYGQEAIGFATATSTITYTNL